MITDEDIAKRAALSGGLSGALLGAGASVFDKSVKNWRGALVNALLGGSAGAAMSGGATYAGSKLLGHPPRPDEASPYTKRGAIGGAVGGGAVGAGLGALASSGIFKVPEGLPPMVRAALTRLQKMPTKKAALLGGLGLGATSAYLGGDEGMQLDFLERQMAEQRRKAFMSDLYGG